MPNRLTRRATPNRRGIKTRIGFGIAVVALVATTVVTIANATTTAANTPTTASVSTASSAQTTATSTANAASTAADASTASSSNGTAVNTGAISGVEKIYVSVVETTPQTSDDVNTGLTQDAVQSLVTKLNSYWSTQSNNKVTVEFGGYETRSLDESTCSPSAALKAEESSAFGGMFANSAWKGTHNHLLVLSAESCSADSFATVGGVGGEIFSGNGINATTGVEYLLHEFGHNLGFEHADGSICTKTTSYDGTAADFGFTSTVCPTLQYDDYLDIMGYTVKNATPGLSSPQRIMAGWLTNYDTLTGATATVTEKLTALGATGGTQALKIVDPTSGDIYYVEYRTNSGLDATSAEFNYGLQCDAKMSGYAICELDSSKTAGVVRVLRVIPFASEGANGTTVLATGLTAGSTDKTKRHTHLDSGDSFTSVDAGFSFKVNSLSPSAGASITVTFGTTGTTTSTAPGSTSSSSSRVPSKTAVMIAHTTVNRGSRDSVRVTVKRVGGAVATGTLTLYVNGKAVHAYALKSGSKGTLILTTPALTTSGSTVVTVVYTGPGNARSSAGGTVTVR